MLPRFRFAFRPRWLVLHLITLALVVAMVLLGRWQLDVSNAKHFNLQNFGYAIQWWLFSAFTLFFWSRILRDAARRDDVSAAPPSSPPAGTADEPVAYRRYVMPTTQDATDATDDPVRSAYNDYLAELAARDEEQST